MSKRKIELILPPPEPHFVGDGFRVHNFIPGGYRMDLKRMDPFLLMDYNSKHYFEPTESPRGVGVHPHRGFETVTIAYRGKVAHHDSEGNSGVIGEGEVQWMTAASGILHKEYHEKEFSIAGGEFQMVQLWVNLPAAYKMSKPKYQGISRDQMVEAQIPGGVVEVIAGEFEGQKGSASTFTPMNLWNIKLNKGGKLSFNINETNNCAALVVEGETTINNEVVSEDHLCVFENEGEAIEITAENEAVILLMSGEPIGEEISAQGPFVMNTREQIQQAIIDYNNGKFGHLE